MIMKINNLRELIANVSTDEKTYAILATNFEFLMKERIKLTQNSLRSLIGRTEQEIEKGKIQQSVKTINEIAVLRGVDFHVQEDWEEIEAFLRMSMLEDISGEFNKQVNN